jgi:hypothetical protein
LLQEVERLRTAEFSPKGDNHHNAMACPYCNPKGSAPEPQPAASKQIVARMSAANAFESQATANLWLAQGMREIERLQSLLLAQTKLNAEMWNEGYSAGKAAQQAYSSAEPRAIHTVGQLGEAIEPVLKALPIKRNELHQLTVLFKHNEDGSVGLMNAQYIPVSMLERPTQPPATAPPPLERDEWTPQQALEFYAAGRHFDVVNGRTRILDTGAIASDALKQISADYASMKGLVNGEADPASAPPPRVTYSQACALLAAYVVAVMDRTERNADPESHAAYMKATKACTDAMGAFPSSPTKGGE